MSRNVRTYTDFDLNFIAHPVTGDITRLTDEEAVKKSVRNLVLTHNYERPFHSDIGTQQLLFELATPMLSAVLKTTISNLIASYEPRANLLDVQINNQIDDNTISISIYFSILNTTKPIKVDVILERTR